VIQPILSKRIGNRWMFAVEFEIHFDAVKAWPATWGSLWLWVEGRVVGKADESEMVMTGFDSLHEVAIETGTRANPLLWGAPLHDALDVVMWARYESDHEPALARLISDPASLFPFEVLPRWTGAFFDGWEAILLENNTSERFIYRQESGSPIEATWPLGTFRQVVNEAKYDFEKAARTLVTGSESMS